MKIEHCWCGSSSSKIHAKFKKRPFSSSSFLINIGRCDNCGTVRMLDNSIDGIPDYEASYEYVSVAGRHLRSIELIEQYHTGDSILDIGCNTGLLLAEIKKKIPTLKNFKGIDLDPKSIEIGKERYQLDLEAIDAKDLEGRYDNIVLCHTLEHVLDMKEMTETLDRLLKPGGKIFISVPNIKSTGANSFLRFWPGLAPEFHVWYFDDESIQKCFQHYLPSYTPLHTSSYFIWKPMIYPKFYWKSIQNNPSKLKKWESEMKGDQLDFVIAKP